MSKQVYYCLIIILAGLNILKADDLTNSTLNFENSTFSYGFNSTTVIIDISNISNETDTTESFISTTVSIDTTDSTSNDSILTTASALTTNASIETKLLFRGDNQTKQGLGINAGTIDSLMLQWVFTNKFKHARDWRPVCTSNNWVNYSWAGALNVIWSDDGYPIVYNFTSWQKCGHQTELGTGGAYPTGNYIITFEGTGNISLYGDAVNITCVNSNRFTFTVNTPTTQGIIIVITKANVTNIDLREEVDEFSNETFSKAYLNALAPFEAIRFSTWIEARYDWRYGGSRPNANVEWVDRRKTSYFTQTGQLMVSIEYIIELANILEKDIWLSMPKPASKDFMLKMAEYVKENLNNKSKIYLEYSSDIGFKNQNRSMNMQMIQVWKSVFNTTRSRLIFVLSTTIYAYFEDVMSFYSAADLKEFDAYSIAGNLAVHSILRDNSFNVSLVNNMTYDDVIDNLRQEIYKDEIELVYQMQKIAYYMPNKPLIGYRNDFWVNAANFNNRAFNRNATTLVADEQKLETLIIEALRQPAVKDLFLDYMERWWKIGGGIMFLSNLVQPIELCPTGGNVCGYKSILENLIQDPLKVPKYKAAIEWLNGNKSSLPFTNADLPPKVTVSCAVNCTWGTCYNGKCVCFDGYSGPSCDILGKKYLDCVSNKTEFGVVLNSVPDWSTEVTFTNVHRRARQWIVHRIVYGKVWADWDQNDLALDDNGYPLYLKTGQSVGTFNTRDIKAHFPAGKYICLYDGDGVLDFAFDAHVTRRGPGRIELDVKHTTELNNGIYYNIIRTNPSNPVRNVRIFEERFENNYDILPFHPLYIEMMKNYKTIRFMPWSNTEITSPLDWSNRTTRSYYSYNLRSGVPIEDQVLLANTLGANPWFNIPYIATDEYIINFATYIRDNVRPDVTIYIEMGNECWGLGTQCGIYAQNMGTIQNLTVKTRYNYYSPSHQARICYHLKSGTYFFNIINRIFNETNRPRPKYVINSQVAWTGPIEVFFLCKGDYYKYYDVVALAPYLSAPLTDKNGNLLYTLDEIFNTVVDSAINSSINAVASIASIVKQNAPQMELALYEAGADFSSLTDPNNYPLTQFSYLIHRDPRMAQALTYYISNMTNIPGIPVKIFNYFASTGQCSKYGCWGMIEASDFDQSLNYSPKYYAYNNYIEKTKICQLNDQIPTNCSNDCNNLGTCGKSLPENSFKDMCYCYFGHNGTNCSSIHYTSSSDTCTYQCGGKGECKFDHYEGYYAINTCHCIEGYYGYGCSLFNCTNECNYNGVCVDYNKCSCYRGYNGTLCDYDCGCNGHGDCNNSTGLCTCDPGYSLINQTCQPDCSITNSTLNECFTCSSDCENGDCVLGKCSCWAGFKNDIRGSCTIKTNAPNDGSKLGVNLNGVVYWSVQWDFVDIVKQAGDWITQYVDNLNNLYLWSLPESLNLTKENYPAVIPFQRQAVTLMLRDVKQHWPDGIYHVFWDGEGNITFGMNSKAISSNDKNRLKIMVNLTTDLNNGVFMKIVKTNPKNPIRNIRIVMDGFEKTYDKIPFHPLFLERLKKFKTIRFMPWTQQDGVTKWSDRITPTSYAQNKGVAYEYQIQLCNILKTNCWLTVPYAADDDFIFQLATLVKNTLRKDVKVDIEYSNEVWNTLFNAGIYAQKMGFQLGLSTNELAARNLFYSLRSQQIIQIWKQVFGSEQDRIVLIAASFTVIPSVSETILSYRNLYKSHSNIVLAITGYISCNDPPAARVVTDDLSVLFAGCDTDLPNIKAFIEKHNVIAKKYNVSLGMYESGSSMMEYSAIESGSTTPGASDKYIAMNRDARFYTVYQNYYKMFDTYNLTEDCHFAFVGPYSIYGPWLLLEYQNQDVSQAYRYQAIMDLIDSTRLNVTKLTDPKCFNLLYNATTVCNGNGVCLSADMCQCDAGFYGRDCVPYDLNNFNGNYFENVDPRLVFILSSLLPNYPQDKLATMASNIILWGPILDKYLNTSVDCNVRSMYYDYLEDKLLTNKNISWITFSRIKQTLDCKEDCNFDRLLSIPNTQFSTNVTDFITKALAYMNSEAAFQCQFDYISILNFTESYVLKNINFITILSPQQIDNLNTTQSFDIAVQLTKENKTLSTLMAQTLASNIPVNTPLDKIASIASQVSLTCINVTNPNTLVSILPQMDIQNMNDFKKSFIVSKISSTNNATLIKNLLISTSDSTFINSIPAILITQLSIDVSNIPVQNLPQSYLMDYSRSILASQNVSSSIDQTTMLKILPGLTIDDLKNIDENTKINSIVNIAKASLTSKVQMNSIQRSTLLTTLLNYLQKISSSSLDSSVYLKHLTTTQIESLYPLFIEANSSVLSGFSKLNSFSTLITQVASIPTSRCCSYSRFNRQLFATYAIPILFNQSTTLSLSNLYSLGSCLASVLPGSYLQNLNSSDFVNYYSTNMGYLFQPNDTETQIVQSLIASYAKSYSSQDYLFFNKLNDLAMFYPLSTYKSSLKSWSSKGNSLINIIKKARDPTNSTIQLCRIGLTNSQTTKTLINSISSNFASNALSNNRRKKRSASLTCTQLNQMTSSLNSLTVNQLLSISNADFISCQILLGSSTNAWSSTQLNALATVAKSAYPTTSSISDNNIAQIKSIFLGYSDSDLATLTFTTTTSINALGSLSDWSSSQLAALATPLTTYLTNVYGGVISSDFLTSAANLACCLSSSQVNSISNAVFVSSVSVLSQISLTCPNIANFYTLAKTVYGSITSSSSKIYQLGTIMNGITTSDFSQISSNQISSITSTAWKFMPSNIVNSMTLNHLFSLTNQQVNSLINSPNYSSFSSVIQSILQVLATGVTNSNQSNSNDNSDQKGLSTGAIIGITFGIAIFLVLLIFGILFLKEMKRLNKIQNGEVKIAWEDNKKKFYNKEPSNNSIHKEPINMSILILESI